MALSSSLLFSAFGPLNSASAETSEAAAETVEFAAPPRAAWAHEIGDIPPMGRATFGNLDNGLRYVIIPNSEPPKRVSLRLHIDAGSLHEADDQRGVAHFLEHMVFNGSKNFPDSSELIPRMQRLGISFGAHANAYTSFDETVYMLDLPNLAGPTLDLSFTVMGDFADGALLAAEEIDKERGVILSEKNSRDSVQMRLMEQQFEVLMPDSLINDRFPIGIEEVIKDAERERFTHFYKNYYIPSKMTFVVVGDIEVEAMEKRIKEIFSELKNPETPAPEPDLGSVPTNPGFQTFVFADPEVPSDDITLLKLANGEPEVDSVALRAERLPLQIAHSLLSRRFSKLAKKEGSSIQGGQASRSVWFQTVDFAAVSVTAKEDRWEDAVATLEQEFRRALEYGFTESELNQVKASLLNAAEQSVARRETFPSPGLAMEVIGSINSQSALSSPEENLRILKESLPQITTEACHTAFKEFWDTENLSLSLDTAEKDDETTSKLLNLYQESQKQEITPPEEREEVAFAYTEFGPAQKATEEKRIADLDITQLVYANNVRVNFKRTDFQKNSISLLARFGTGLATMPEEKPGLNWTADALLNSGGLEAHSETELQEILAGKNVSAGFSIGGKDMNLVGSTTPDDLLLELQLMCAYLTAPGFREEALRTFHAALPDFYDGLRHDLSGAQSQMEEWLYSNDPRFVTPSLEEALALTKEETLAWIKPQLDEDPIELTIVGDFAPEALREALSVTFGALPKRGTATTIPEEKFALTFPSTPQEKTFTYESKLERSSALVMWKTFGFDKEISDLRRLNVVASILRDRMRKKIREEIGATYSPSAYSNPSNDFPEFGCLVGSSIAKPEDLEKINKITLELGATLAESGATADELERTLNPILSSLEESERTNGYWLGTVMSHCQEEPFRLKWARERNKDYESISLESVNELAAKYLKPENAVAIRLEPAAPADESTEN